MVLCSSYVLLRHQRLLLVISWEVYVIFSLSLLPKSPWLRIRSLSHDIFPFFYSLEELSDLFIVSDTKTKVIISINFTWSIAENGIFLTTNHAIPLSNSLKLNLLGKKCSMTAKKKKKENEKKEPKPNTQFPFWLLLLETRKKFYYRIVKRFRHANSIQKQNRRKKERKKGSKFLEPAKYVHQLHCFFFFLLLLPFQTLN